MFFFFIVNILNCIPVCPWTCKSGFFPYWAYIRTDDVLSQSAVLDYHLDVNTNLVLLTNFAGAFTFSDQLNVKSCSFRDDFITEILEKPVSSAYKTNIEYSSSWKPRCLRIWIILLLSMLARVRPTSQKKCRKWSSTR